MSGGWTLRVETRRRISDALKGRKLSTSHRRKVLACLSGRRGQGKLVACDLCGRRPKGGCYKDHDHLTRKHRGMLCPSCNTGLGLFHDDPELLRKAIRYVGRGK